MVTVLTAVLLYDLVWWTVGIDDVDDVPGRVVGLRTFVLAAPGSPLIVSRG